jgi:hypothetical protein
LILFAVVLFFLFRKPRLSWFVVCIGLIIESALDGKFESALIWCLALILSGFMLESSFQKDHQLSWVPIIGFVGILPLPFLPVWSGMGLFSNLVQDLPMILSLGLAVGCWGREFRIRIRDDRVSLFPLNPLSLVGPIVLLLSLYLISISSGLFYLSISLLSVPFLAWLPALLMVPGALLGMRIPVVKTSALQQSSSRLQEFFKISIDAITGLIDGIISLIAGIIEGEGGLIWALLLGFLIITLISIGGR